MIHIKKKEDCCGCSACVQSCPKHCISMTQDEEGFYYPEVDLSLCINCGLCEQVCPVINQSEVREPLHTYASFYKNESIRLQSSSGGMFTCFAEQVIRKGGVVFGAQFNDKWEVVHSYVETIEDLERLRGSKYVQSQIGDSYILVKRFLDNGRLVLFSGTPCQVAGLNHFLKRKYENLYTIDIVCHGVPSPLVWQKYLQEISVEEISSISFRNKDGGWKNFNFRLDASEKNQRGKQLTCVLEEFRKNIYCNGFMHNLYLRPSCYHCPAKSGKSGSQLTLADLWGVERIYPEIDDDKGCSLVLTYEDTSLKFDNCVVKDVDLSSALVSNKCISQSVPMSPNRKAFFKTLSRKGMIKSTKKYTREPLSEKVTFKVKHALYLFLSKFIKL